MPIRFLAALALAASAFAAGAASDAGGKPPSQPVAPATEKADSPRCKPAAVNECRSACDKKKYEASTPKPEIAKKTQECKQACIQGC